jgi:tricorn protease
MRLRFFSPILTLLAAGALAAPSNLGYYMQPAIGGGSIVFVSQGGLWKVPATGGVAHPLTTQIAPASYPAISPDGRSVAFTGTYSGPPDAYVMSMDGDLPTRLTYSGGVRVVGWTPDGKVLVASSINSTLPNQELSEIDPRTRVQKIEPLAQASEGSYDPSIKTLFFTRLPFQGSQTKRYKGGYIQQIWSYADSAAEAKNLTGNFDGASKDPMVWRDRVYFLSDRDGTMNLWSMDRSGGSLKQLTHYVDWDIQSASMDNGKIAYQVKAGLHVFDVPTSTDTPLEIVLASDFDPSRDEWVKTPSAYISSARISSNGENVVITSRGKLFVAPAEPGRFVTLTRTSGARYRDAVFAPDGKSVLALSDQSGENEWWRLPATGVGTPVQITHDSKVLSVEGSVSPDGTKIAYGNKNAELWVADTKTGEQKLIYTSQDGEMSELHWSPDSQWLAYVAPTLTFDRIALYSVKTGKSTPVTSDRFTSNNPTWSQDGKWLFFLSNRTFRTVVGSPWGERQPEPYFDKQSNIYLLGLTKGLRSPFQPADELYTPPTGAKPPTGPVTVDVDLDGIQSRLWEAPVPAGNYSQLTANSQRMFVISRSAGRSELQTLEFTNKTPALKTILPEAGSYELARDGKKLLVVKMGQMFVVEAGGAPIMLEKPVDLSGWSMEINPRIEWRQLFVDAWRLHRDFFYDQHMNGVDWKANLAKYLPLVDRVGDRSELNNLIAQMVGELSVLHTFVHGGDVRQSSEDVAPAFLGGALTRDEKLGGYRVDRIYQGEPDYPDSLSPLVRPGVDMSVGDVIETVNGLDLLSMPDLSAALRNQAGRQVLIMIKDRSGKEREAIVEPISAGANANLRYTDWEVSRRMKVDSESKGDIGYVHLRAMGGGDIDQFERDFYPNLGKSGLIIDVRHNNGGNIDSWLLERLLRKAWFFFQSRVGEPSWNMQWAFRGHVVVLCDQMTASDGEAFTEGIKRLGIAKVIGMRTWGGEIWLSSDNVLEDGGIASAAENGVYGLGGKWLIEGHGVDPDFVVDNLPHSTFLGKDAQLDAALDYLAREIKANPVKVPPHPPYPDKSFPETKH